jgi:ATP synthase proteolipid subunit
MLTDIVKDDDGFEITFKPEFYVYGAGSVRAYAASYATAAGTNEAVFRILFTWLGAIALENPCSAPFFGFMGVISALVFVNKGSANGTVKSGVGISSMGVNPAFKFMSDIIIPSVMAGVLGIYGLVIAMFLTDGESIEWKNTYVGYAKLFAGDGVILPGCDGIVL